jgi:hypothetical protein
LVSRRRDTHDTPFARRCGGIGGAARVAIASGLSLGSVEGEPRLIERSNLRVDVVAETLEQTRVVRPRIGSAEA